MKLLPIKKPNRKFSPTSGMDEGLANNLSRNNLPPENLNLSRSNHGAIIAAF